MAYNNYNNFRPQGGGYYNNRPFYNSNRYNSRPKKKHSGCRKSTISKGSYQGSTCFTGWNYSKQRGLMTALATPYKKSKEHKAKSGRIYVPFMVKLVFRRTGEERIVSGLFEPSQNRVFIPSMNMVMKPNSPNGGYFGQIKR